MAGTGRFGLMGACLGLGGLSLGSGVSVRSLKAVLPEIDRVLEEVQ